MPQRNKPTSTSEPSGFFNSMQRLGSNLINALTGTSRVASSHDSDASIVVEPNPEDVQSIQASDESQLNTSEEGSASDSSGDNSSSFNTPDSERVGGQSTSHAVAAATDPDDDNESTVSTTSASEANDPPPHSNYARSVYAPSPEPIELYIGPGPPHPAFTPRCLQRQEAFYGVDERDVRHPRYRHAAELGIGLRRRARVRGLGLRNSGVDDGGGGAPGPSAPGPSTPAARGTRPPNGASGPRRSARRAPPAAVPAAAPTADSLAMPPPSWIPQRTQAAQNSAIRAPPNSPATPARPNSSTPARPNPSVTPAPPNRATPAAPHPRPQPTRPVSPAQGIPSSSQSQPPFFEWTIGRLRFRVQESNLPYVLVTILPPTPQPPLPASRLHPTNPGTVSPTLSNTSTTVEPPTSPPHPPRSPSPPSPPAPPAPVSPWEQFVQDLREARARGYIQHQFIYVVHVDRHVDELYPHLTPFMQVLGDTTTRTIYQPGAVWFSFYQTPPSFIPAQAQLHSHHPPANVMQRHDTPVASSSLPTNSSNRPSSGDEHTSSVRHNHMDDEDPEVEEISQEAWNSAVSTGPTGSLPSNSSSASAARRRTRPDHGVIRRPRPEPPVWGPYRYPIGPEIDDEDEAQSQTSSDLSDDAEASSEVPSSSRVSPGKRSRSELDEDESQDPEHSSGSPSKRRRSD
ncbi:unnamed protein product [Somion occarium]|uniref:Uncharacterized protein n=1 Tax=Somion occarium TaxID=3059160 RepID=A0ABP1D444_9APHY